MGAGNRIDPEKTPLLEVNTKARKNVETLQLGPGEKVISHKRFWEARCRHRKFSALANQFCVYSSVTKRAFHKKSQMLLPEGTQGYGNKTFLLLINSRIAPSTEMETDFFPGKKTQCPLKLKMSQV